VEVEHNRMKILGLLGGMSWESTVVYYRWINEYVGTRLGGLHSARIVLYSVDFAELEAMQSAGRWDEAGEVLAEAAGKLEAAGAEIMVLCTNTMHVVAPRLAGAVSAPWIHIADATGTALNGAGFRRVGLLGTRYTMEGGFYRDRLADRYGLDVLVPDQADRRIVHDVIYDELCRGRVNSASTKHYQRIVDTLGARGAEAVILGCTEIGMLLSGENSSLPVFDTARIHAERAAAVALGLETLPEGC
jgi:aspartate racemase